MLLVSKSLSDVPYILQTSQQLPLNLHIVVWFLLSCHAYECSLYCLVVYEYCWIV